MSPARFAGKTALGRLVDPPDAASAITGQTLVVDCGLPARSGQPIQPGIFDETKI